MKSIHVPRLPEIEHCSPHGKFHSFCKNISVALGARRRVGDPGEVHPFDLQQRRVPAGASICPYHSHAAQWEMFVVLAGSGTERVNGSVHPITAGDVYVHAPGTAHQTTNTGADELVVLIIADNPPCDIWHYPDSNKWGLSPHGAWFRPMAAHYFDGEDSGGEPAVPVPARPAAFGPPGDFRKLQQDALPWEHWESPAKRFRGASKELSIALGAVRNAPPHEGGHPFDLEVNKLAPGDRGCPFHSHAAQSELFLILSGTGTVRTPEGRFEVRAGDAILHPPGEAHDLTNTGSHELLYFLIADNPPVDIWHYPDSDKWGFRPPRKIFRAAEIDYWAGEE
jgi:uncharacterized cupin superfamily protein